MNKIAKGRKSEKLFADLLKKRGFTVWKPTNCKFGKKDVFGLFDLLAIHRQGDLYMIQVKTGNKTNFYKARKDIEKFIKSFFNLQFYVSVVHINKKKILISIFDYLRFEWRNKEIDLDKEEWGDIFAIV